MASATHVTEKRIAHQNQQQQRKQAILKCPRCNSSNTKFCYYNNYSLSQPRHFCKACKRYWTSGGTLRNVPVGGSCRKNKRIKTTFTTTGDHNSNPNCNCNLDLSTPSNNKLNPLYGSLLQNPKYPRFNTRVSGISDTDVSRYDLIHPQMNSLRLGFSSSDPGASLVANHVHNSTSLVTSYPSMLSGGLTANCNNDNTMASLLSSSLQQQPTFMGFAPYGNVGGSVVKDDTIVGTKGSTDWNNSFNGQNDNDQMNVVESCDPTSFLWTITGGYGGERA